MGGLSVWHILLVLVVIMILFGAGKLPKVMGDLGKGIKNFKEGLNTKDDAGDAPKAVPSDAAASMRSSESSTSETRKS